MELEALASRKFAKYHAYVRLHSLLRDCTDLDGCAFAEFRRRRQLNDMSVKQLVKRQQQVEMNIWRVKSELAKGDKPHLDATRQERLAGYEKERADILRLLE